MGCPDATPSYLTCLVLTVDSLSEKVDEAMQGKLPCLMLQLSEQQTNRTISIAATFILNDDVDSAEAGLAKGTSSFHNVREPANCDDVAQNDEKIHADSSK